MENQERSIGRVAAGIRYGRCLAIATVALALSVGLPAAGAAAAPAPQKPVASAPELANPQLERPEAERQAREAFRLDMQKIPLPKNGCFTAVYPKRVWIETHCGRPSQHQNAPRGRLTGGHKPVTNLVGNGTDYVARSAGTVASTTGSFLAPSSVNAVSGPVLGGASANDVFMLQINTQLNLLNDGTTFATAACNGHFGCSGWEQFLFSQTQGPPPGLGQSSVPGTGATTPGVFIEYWLIGYGSPCPALPAWALGGAPAGTLWGNDGAGDCVFNGPTTYVPPQTAAGLAGMVMTAASTAAQDTVTLTTSSGIYVYAEPDILGLSAVWRESEFNEFGDCCSSNSTFTAPSLLIVKTTLNDGTANVPTCVANDGSTAETNNLTFVPNPAGICCPYGGATPSVEFMEGDSGAHIAWCGATRLEGDPHLTIADGTANGTHYDFQGVGEFVALKRPDGAEIQTRHTQVVTGYSPPTDSHDGLASTVAIVTAVATRVGTHRVTWEPNLSGVPDPSGLQLRIDGALATLGPGVALSGGGRVASAGGALAIDFPDGMTMLVTPQWWASQSKWYLNVDISNLGIVTDAGTPSIRGIATRIPQRSWLPVLPNGASMGVMPAAVPTRFNALYGTFANAWRVTDKTTLFDYAKNTSTATFVSKDWPRLNPKGKPVDANIRAAAETACRRMKDEARRHDCMFDILATGDVDFAKTYLVTERNITVVGRPGRDR